MTGPEHYIEAERNLKYAAEIDGDWMSDRTRYFLAVAQVHATLANAAATAGLDAVEGPGGGSATGRIAEDGNGWLAALHGRHGGRAPKTSGEPA